ncbi:hypothetical protein [Acetobacterium wieringae]|uniref:hypothetical protein n=1 Tax=Acetobacterium wieringae TaxID=52694 RepID=UPI002B1F7A8E|nr:hypothetical protein [Acetobacterium wieringae]MEA4804789.1 hypothetical protein [Acetobacterium wieringae]
MIKPKDMDVSTQLLRLFERIHVYKTHMENTNDLNTIHLYQFKMIGMLEAACVTGIICPGCEEMILKDLEARHLWAWGNCPEPLHYPVPVTSILAEKE